MSVSFYELGSCPGHALKHMAETNQKEYLSISNREIERGDVGEQSKGDWTTASGCQGDATDCV